MNLPRKDKFATPRYQAIEGDEAKLLSSEDGGAWLRLIAGDAAEHLGPVAIPPDALMPHRI